MMICPTIDLKLTCHLSLLRDILFYLRLFIVKLRNIWNMTGQKSMHISDIFNFYRANVKRKKFRQEIQNICIYTNLNDSCVNIV